MVEVIWPDEVLDQLDQIKAYIRLFDAMAADRITERLTELGNSLADFPNRGRPGPHGSRQLTTVAPYVLSYKMVGNLVAIVDVRHGRRQPLD